MILIFELIYSLLPIGGENVAIMAMKSLGNLITHQYVCFKAGNRGGTEFWFFFLGKKIHLRKGRCIYQVLEQRRMLPVPRWLHTVLRRTVSISLRATHHWGGED